MRQGTSDGELRTAIRTLSLGTGTEAEAERAAAELVLLHGLEDLDDLRRLVRHTLRRWQGGYMGWISQDEIKRVLEKAQGSLGYTARDNKGTPESIRQEAADALKGVNEALDKIRAPLYPSGGFEYP